MINGTQLACAIISGANNIENNRTAVDALNVFPVPDGDTGTNMSMTMGAARQALSALPDGTPVGEVAAKAAAALLRGARGNSGVILSLIFRGFSKPLEGLEKADCKSLAQALEQGTKAAYDAVTQPTEGTMLTVIREACRAAKKYRGSDEAEMWAQVCSAAQKTLERTPEMLSVLKRAGVVDAGGQGLVTVLTGMLSVFEGKGITAPNGDEIQTVSVHERNIDTANREIKFGYCTEYIVNRSRSDGGNPDDLKAFLCEIGDCVAVIDDEDIIKVHVHSNEPGNAIQAGLKYGALVNIKVDNMRYQHSNVLNTSAGNVNTTGQQKIGDVREKYGFVSVSSGEGFDELFGELGVSTTVKGGQTMNPSTQDILNAIESARAEHIFVLPNNKNIIMAAEQAANISKQSVSVIKTQSLPQGIAAMLCFDEEKSAQQNALEMSQAAAAIGTGLVTLAAKDSRVNEQRVRKGQVLGIENGKITIIEHDPIKAGYKLARRMYRKQNGSVITVYYGDDTTRQQAQELAKLLRAHCSGAQVSVINGGQPIYKFIISVE